MATNEEIIEEINNELSEQSSDLSSGFVKNLEDTESRSKKLAISTTYLQ